MPRNCRPGQRHSRAAAADGLVLGAQRHAHARLAAGRSEGKLDVLPLDAHAAGIAEIGTHGAQRPGARRRAAATRRSRRSRPLDRIVPHAEPIPTRPPAKTSTTASPSIRRRPSRRRLKTRFSSLELGCDARRRGGQLRFGLQLRLFLQHLLADPQFAPHQGDRPAGGLRPAFRPRRMRQDELRGGPSAARAEPAGLCGRRHPRLAGPPQRQRPPKLDEYLYAVREMRAPRCSGRQAGGPSFRGCPQDSCGRRNAPAISHGTRGC